SLSLHPCSTLRLPPGARRRMRPRQKRVQERCRCGSSVNAPAVTRYAAEFAWQSAALIRLLSKLGPGLVTGAVDDDPGGLATCAVAGSSAGYATLWIFLFTLPLMVAVQLICARIGMVSGVGLTAALRDHYPRWLLWLLCMLLLAANIFNIGADL